MTQVLDKKVLKSDQTEEVLIEVLEGKKVVDLLHPDTVKVSIWNFGRCFEMGVLIFCCFRFNLLIAANRLGHLRRQNWSNYKITCPKWLRINICAL